MSALRQSKGGKKKVAIVSGGSRGLGAELISGFLDRGYCVATLSRSGSRFIEALSKKQGQKAFLWEPVDARCRGGDGAVWAEDPRQGADDRGLASGGA